MYTVANTINLLPCLVTNANETYNTAEKIINCSKKMTRKASQK